jgi:hypothetical protein
VLVNLYYPVEYFFLMLVNLHDSGKISLLMLARQLKIEVSLCMAVVFRLKINGLIGCEFDVYYGKVV